MSEGTELKIASAPNNDYFQPFCKEVKLEVDKWLDRQNVAEDIQKCFSSKNGMGKLEIFAKNIIENINERNIQEEGSIMIPSVEKQWLIKWIIGYITEKFGANK